MTRPIPPGAPRRRAPKGSAAARTVVQPVRLTRGERAAWAAEAQRRGITISELVRLAMAAIAPTGPTDAVAHVEALARVAAAAHSIIEHDDRVRTGGHLEPYEGTTLRDRLRAELRRLDGAASLRAGPVA